MTQQSRAHGLTIASRIPLPELPVTPFEGAADVVIAPGPVQIPADARRVDRFSHVRGDDFFLDAPAIARVRVSRGAEIVVDPIPGAEAAAVRLVTLGSAWGALLYQRGLLVLHGNAIRLGDGVLVCIGPSGIGKSTLAAAMLRRGLPVLSDDVVAVDAAASAIGGMPRIKLWRDAAERFGHDVSTLPRVGADIDKYQLALSPAEDDRPLPVKWIRLLARGSAPQPLVTEISGVGAFQALRANSYRPQYIAGPGNRLRHFELATRLASAASIARITRPEAGFSVDALVDTVLESCDSNAGATPRATA